jgi:hypothetical protein
MKFKKYYKENQDSFAEDLFEQLSYDLKKIVEFLKNEECLEYNKKIKKAFFLQPQERNEIGAVMIEDLIKRLQ